MYDAYDVLVIATLIFWTITLTLFFVQARQGKDKKANEALLKQMASIHLKYQMKKNAFRANDDSTDNLKFI